MKKKYRILQLVDLQERRLISEEEQAELKSLQDPATYA